jgi:hypothetical protein
MVTLFFACFSSCLALISTFEMTMSTLAHASLSLYTVPGSFYLLPCLDADENGNILLDANGDAYLDVDDHEDADGDDDFDQNNGEHAAVDGDNDFNQNNNGEHASLVFFSTYTFFF